jgi:hypothetical protein
VTGNLPALFDMPGIQLTFTIAVSTTNQVTTGKKLVIFASVISVRSTFWWRIPKFDAHATKFSALIVRIEESHGTGDRHSARVAS